MEFEYQDGQIRSLLCDCPCSCACKHEFAALLQLKETLALIESRHGEEFAKSGYFAAILRSTLFTVSVYGKETGSITLTGSGEELLANPQVKEAYLGSK